MVTEVARVYKGDGAKHITMCHMTLTDRIRLLRTGRAGWLGAALAVGLLWLGWQAWRAPEVDAVQVRQAPLLRTVQFSARVATMTRADVGSTVTGRVLEVWVDEGGAVQRGQVLLRLESDEARAALMQAQAAERQAQARWTAVRGPLAVQAAAAEAQAVATARAAQAETVRVRQLVAQGFVSDARRDDAERALAVAQAQLTAAQSQVQSLAEGGADWEQARAQLALAQAATQAAQARLDLMQVRAPADGRVLVRTVEPGQTVQPGQALFSLALTGPVQLKAQVDERFLEQLQEGQPATVVADAYAQQRWGAKVMRIAPAVDAQRGSVEVTLALEFAPPAFLREDMTVSVEVETGRRAQALVLPLAALRQQRPEGVAQVLVAQDGRAEKRDVKLGLRTLELVEVTDGLAAGDAVLLNPAAAAGQRVRIRWVAVGATAAAERNPVGGAGAALTNAMGR